MTSKTTYRRRKAAADLGFVYVKPGVYPAPIAAQIEVWREEAEAALAEKENHRTEKQSRRKPNDV